MNTHETRVSQAFRGVECLADSPIDTIAPQAPGRFQSFARPDIRISNADESATVGEAQSTSGSLSEAQLATFWDGILANYDAARGMAARFVPSHSVLDVVHTAAVQFVEDAQQSKKPEPFPASANRFRRKFLKMVCNHAIDCIRGTRRPACSVHSNWGVDEEPFVGGSNLANRDLDTVFARNDRGRYDAPAPTVRRAEDDLDGLHGILRSHMEDLTQIQREIIDDAFFKGLSRPEIAARRGITLNTFDNHRKAACRKLRESMMALVDFATGIDLPDWYDRIEKMNTRHAARQRRRAFRKKEKRSNSEGARSNFKGDPTNSRHAR